MQALISMSDFCFHPCALPVWVNIEVTLNFMIRNHLYHQTQDPLNNIPHVVSVETKGIKAFL